MVVAALISMAALVLYGGVSPFLDDAADRLATFAQLMTFLTLFAAILLEVRGERRRDPRMRRRWVPRRT